MLIKIKRLIIENEGYKRNFSIKPIIINKMSIISIVDYDGVNDFLIREESSLYNKRFSLIRVNEGREIAEIIALGTAEEIYESTIERDKGGKQLLNE